MSEEKKKYATILDVLSATKQAKEFLKEEAAMNAAAIEAVIEAERYLVSILLEGKELVAFSEKEVTAIQNAAK